MAGILDTGFGFGEQTKKEEQKKRPQPPKPKKLSLEETWEFWKKNRSPANMKHLLDKARPVLRRALTSFAGGDGAYMARAKALAVAAFKTYNPARGARLRTHLYVRLQPLQRLYMKRTSILAVPERVQLDQYRVDQAERALRADLGREPSDSEIADRAGLSPRRIAHVRGFTRGVLTEGQMVTPERGLQLPGSERVSADDILVEYMHHDLSPVDKRIMEWKKGIYGKKRLSNNEIARRLGITPGAVSQRAARITARLEEARRGA